MTFPLRIEYLSREDQLNLSNQEIAVVTVMIFFGAKVLSMFLWGKLFDQMHFMKFRILLNIQMIIAILIYFNSSGFIGVVIGSAYIPHAIRNILFIIYPLLAYVLADIILIGY